VEVDWPSPEEGLGIGLSISSALSKACLQRPEKSFRFFRCRDAFLVPTIFISIFQTFVKSYHENRP